MRIERSGTQHKANRVLRDQAISVGVAEDAKGHGAHNWSTEKPAYAGTSVSATRAEKRRYEKENSRNQIYTLNAEQIRKLKEDATVEAARTAFLLMLGIPILMFKDHFGKLMKKEEDGKSREERFAKYCLDFYSQFDAGFYDLDDIKAVLKQECDIELEPLYKSMKQRIV